MTSWQSRVFRIIFRLRDLVSRRLELDVHQERAAFEALAATFESLIDAHCTAVAADGVPAEWILPEGVSDDRIVLYLHGGSYSAGSSHTHCSLISNVADAVGARALALNYRLAPENPFPAAVEDALTAYRWLLSSRVPAARIAVVGDSAGGGLALALLVAARDAGEPMPAAAVCLSPWTDLAGSGESWTANLGADLIIERDKLLASARWYLGDADPRTPLASPLYADFTGLPPLLIQVGSEEILLSDAAGVAERAEAAGVAVTLEVWEGMQHVWQFSAKLLPEAGQAIERIGAFTRRAW
jgi:acetyl esterase/lipase